MTSMLCDKQHGGTVEVQDKNKVEELVIDGQNHIQTTYINKTDPFLQRKKLSRPYSTPNLGCRTGKIAVGEVDPDALMGHTLKLQDWINEKSIKNIQEKSDLETRNTKQLWEDMLNVESSFVKEMGDLVTYKQLLDLRKKELLHKRWSDHVYQPIRKQVVSEVKSPEFDEFFQRKRHVYKQYLEHVNKKGHVFLETFDPAEYYPMALNPVRPGSITAQTKRLKDPLLHQERERCNEDRVIMNCHLGSHLTDADIQQIRLPPLPLVPLGRHGTEASTWVAMPMGDIESSVRMASSTSPHHHLHSVQTQEKSVPKEKLPVKKLAWSSKTPLTITSTSLQREPDSLRQVVSIRN